MRERPSGASEPTAPVSGRVAPVCGPRQAGQPFCPARPYRIAVTADPATDAGSDTGTVAERVVVRYEPATDTVRRELNTTRYASYLRTARAGAVAAGDEWAEFVNCGCGTTEDVTLSVVGVSGGDRIGEATDFEFVPANGEDE